MLLFFWGVQGSRVGMIDSLRWHHDIDYPPRFFGAGETGLSIINPFLDVVTPECSYVSTSSKVTSSCWFHDEILIGTESQGYRIPWSIVKDVACNVGDPVDLGSWLVDSYTVSSGLPSNSILRMDSFGDYLGILTSGGLYWENYATGDKLTFLTDSGTDVFISQGAGVYLSAGQTLLIKASLPADFYSWDEIIECSGVINRIWVNTNGGLDTLFLATGSGLFIKQENQMVGYLDTISGSKDILDIGVELGADISSGHVFLGSSDGVNIINLRSGKTEQYLDYSGNTILGLGCNRFYSK
jgi:hypothetical protein